jgi:hypothetical protein
VIETDAYTGFGAVLMQQGKPIALISYTFSDKSKLIYVYGGTLVHKWGQYFLGKGVLE